MYLMTFDTSKVERKDRRTLGNNLPVGSDHRVHFMRTQITSLAKRVPEMHPPLLWD